MSSKGPVVLVLTFWLPCLLSHTRKTLWYYWFPRESWKQISRAMTEQAKLSTQRALEPRSAGGAAVGADGRGEQKERLWSRQISDPSSPWLEWRHEEGWDGARGKAKSRSWIGLEALAYHHFRAVITRYCSLSSDLCCDNLAAYSNAFGLVRSLLLLMRSVVILVIALLFWVQPFWLLLNVSDYNMPMYYNF